MQKIISVFISIAILTPLFYNEVIYASRKYYWSQPQIRQKTNIAERIRKLRSKSRIKPAQSNQLTHGQTYHRYKIYRNPSVLNRRNFAKHIRSNRKVYPTRNFKPVTISNQKPTLKISSRPIPINKPISKISDQVIPLFELNFQNPKPYRTTQFIPAISVDKMAFQLIDNAGIISDASLFSLVIGHHEFPFERNGKVVIDFSSFRLAGGKSRSIEIGIKANDPDNLPRLNGSFRVRIEAASATKESTSIKVPAKLYGPSISKFITLYPRPETSGNPVLAGTPQTIFSRTLSAGEKATVLGFKLGATYDDMVVRKINVRNVYGNSIDSWVNRVNLINYNNNTTVASTRFVNGVAKFNILQNKIQIPRNSKVHLGIEVELSSTLNTSQNTKFKLDIQTDDIEVVGIGSGREVPNSQKVITLDAQPFFVTQAGGGNTGGIVSLSDQPPLFATGVPEPVYRFKIVNNGNREFSLSRFTLSLYPNGLNFVGGGVNDFKLLRALNGHEINGLEFNTTLIGSNTVRFDAQNEIYIPAHQSAEFSLRVALVNAGNVDKRSLGIKILGDESLHKGTLSSVRASGANFIWSDHSGAPHVDGSADWISGYLFPGLPTQIFVNKQ